MRIVITGKGSYIGSKVAEFLKKYGHKTLEIDTISENWKEFDFSEFEAVIHVAAIVHDSAKKSGYDLFEKVNTKLPYDIAKKAKECGVSRFVFLSSMAVYGLDKKLPEGQTIDSNTPLNPVSLYGKSKLEAEKLLQTLADESFKVSIIRPPNVYGKGCKGNYISRFISISKLPIFPLAYTQAKQSMIYIDNLSCLIKEILENDGEGVYNPQDSFIPSTVDLVSAIADAHSKKICFSKFLGKVVCLFGKLPIVTKLYGGVSYSQEFVYFENRYRIVDFDDAIRQTVEQD